MAGTSRYEVTGPGVEGRPVPSLAAAYAVALDWASRGGECSFYVRDNGAIVGRADGNREGGARLYRMGAAIPRDDAVPSAIGRRVIVPDPDGVNGVRYEPRPPALPVDVEYADEEETGQLQLGAAGDQRALPGTGRTRARRRGARARIGLASRARTRTSSIPDIREERITDV